VTWRHAAALRASTALAIGAANLGARKLDCALAALAMSAGRTPPIDTMAWP